MKRLFLSLLSVIWLTGAICSLPMPAVSQAAWTEVETTCTPSHAEFNTIGVGYSENGSDIQRGDGKPYVENNANQYPGLATHIFSCKISGHYVRINFHSTVSQHMCGANESGAVSVWVDGVKVINGESWGGYDSCMTEMSDGHATAHSLTKVILNKLMHLTVCHADTWYDKKTSQTIDDPPTCSVDDLSKLKPDTRSTYYGEVKLTPPSLLLTTNHAAFCKAATDQLNSAQPDQGILTAFQDATPTPKTDEQKQKGYERMFTLDVDNDGAPDILTYKGLGIGEEFNYGHTFTWLSGKTKQTYDIRDNWPRSLDAGLLNVDDSRSFRFVKIAGQIYAYHENDDLQMMDAGSDEKVGASDRDGKITTHHIVELHNDGTITEICSWRPRQRPEEYL